MFFGKKSKKKEIICSRCNSAVEKEHSFCPYCGFSIIDEEEYKKEFGLLGKNDYIEEDMSSYAVLPSLGLTDKIINSLMNSIVKSLDKQFREIERTEVSSFPNGIKIKVGVQTPRKQQKQKSHEKIITNEQLQKMQNLPRTEAKTNIRRLSDKVIYELSTPGLASPEDVFVSKLESGYEIKAIGNKKVYVKSLPINLPIRGFLISDNKLLIEFKTQEE